MSEVPLYVMNPWNGAFACIDIVVTDLAPNTMWLCSGLPQMYSEMFVASLHLYRYSFQFRTVDTAGFCTSQFPTK